MPIQCVRKYFDSDQGSEVSDWFMSNSLGLFWHIVPVVCSVTVVQLFLAVGPEPYKFEWPLNGIHDRLPPGWITAAGHQDILYVLKEQFS